MKRPFVVSASLTAISIGYRNPSNSYIADAVSPRDSVDETFKYTVYPISEAFKVPDGRVGRRGQVQQLVFSGDELEATVEDFGFDAPIPISDIETARRQRELGLSNYDPEATAVMRLGDTLLNCREVRVANQFQNAANFAVGRKTTLAGNSQFSDYTNSDPIGVISAGFDATLVFRPTDMAMGRDVWSKLNSHPKLVNAVKGGNTNQGKITPEQFVEIFAGEGLQRLHIGDAWCDVSKPGQAPTLRRAWGKHITLFHQNPLANVKGDGGVTFAMTADCGGKIAGRIEDPDIGLQGGYRIRNGERLKELLLAPDVGYFIQNAVA